MAIVEEAFFKAGLYAAAALIGYRHGADVPGLGPAIDDNSPDLNQHSRVTRPDSTQ